jgi:hypothetical protein
MNGHPPTAEQWLRHLLPLPHQIAFGQTATCHPGEVGLGLRTGAGPVERQAAAELEALFLRQSGRLPRGSRFEILLGLADGQGRVEGVPLAGLSRLAEVPNREQAYLIEPLGDRGLVLAGLGEKGVYYAALTLAQLLRPSLGPERVAIPLVEVADWPDLEERGLWNFPQPAAWIPWLASLKLNYGKMADTRLQPVARGQKNRALIDRDLLEQSRLRAFNYVPYILHLNFLHDLGLFSAYPELAGVGDGALAGRYLAHKQGNQHRVPCASQPLLVQILAEWLADLAAQGALEVSCWLSERPAQCGCRQCTAAGQFVQEARAFVAAWRQVLAQYPDFRIRLFLSTTTPQKDHQVLAEAPPEVRIERACATQMERVPCEPRDLLANPLFDRHAAGGRWLASYDVPLTVNANVDTPEFKLPESSAHRVRDCVRQLRARGYRGAYGMMAWQALAREICGYNIAALAEWAWNADGRTEREFALAWATRQGHEAPEQVGEWAARMGEIEFDVYDSDFPICYSWGQAAEMVRQRRRPCLGEGMFRYYRGAEDFDRKLEVCARALRLAGGWADPLPALETEVVRSYVGLARAIYQVAEQVALEALSRVEEQQRLRLALEALRRAGEENTAAIRAWRSALGPEPWHHRVHDALAATERTVREICAFAEERYLYLLGASAGGGHRP